MNNKQINSNKSKNISSIYPLSPMQQGILFHSLYAPNSGVYVEQMAISFQANINVVAFESAWQKVIDRHPVLRTLFVWENRSNPLQVVLKQVKLPWTNLDWVKLSPTEQQEQLKELLLQQKQKGFSLNQAPLMECTLIKQSFDTYKFIWNFHHILIDGWCIPIIFKEFFSFYDAAVQGKTCELPTPLPYRNYINWLGSQDQKTAIEFWRKNLQGFSAPTSLRVNKTKLREEQHLENQQMELVLSRECTQKLQFLAKENRITLSTIVQAAWALLLSRYSGETDVVFGVVTSGRNMDLAGVESMVGLLINTLPLRIQIPAKSELIAWLGKIQESMVELQQYSYLSLVDIQDVSEISAGIPLFNTIMAFENYPVDSSLLNEKNSLQIKGLESFEQTNYSLSLLVIPKEQLSVNIGYDTANFEPDTIERMVGHYENLLSAMVENPSQTVDNLQLISSEERQKLLVEWNNTASQYPKDKCIHQLFEEQVAKTPDAIALVFEDQELTYQQLNGRANQLANDLQGLGVGPEILVGVCVERSIEMVVGLLAILKAGGAYVPLDPSYPQERLSYMLNDAAVKVLLTQSSLLESLPPHNAQVVSLDTYRDAVAESNQGSLDSELCANNLAYIIYTSGSTGKPKGVAIEHHSLCNLAKAQANLFDVESTSRILQFASFSFDASVWEIFMALTSGASLILATASKLMPGSDLWQTLHQHKVTHVTLPPSALAVMSTDELTHLSHIIVAGEACLPELVNKWSASRRFFNAYGPSESTVCATVAKLTDSNEKITIGRPIANTQIYILDQELQPVPVGVPGELHIGGVGLARGYLNRAELTKEKFISNPFEDHSRLYKTGDLARYLPNGNIEFLGRLDNQVKMRGFRIEVGEIESVLNTHPQVQQVTVMEREDTPGNKQLVAYLVPLQVEQRLLEDNDLIFSEAQNQLKIANSLSIQQVREFLMQKLPEYMVPNAFVTLDSLPLTPNGKVDRKALPAPDIGLTREHEYVPPQTETEKHIATVLQEVLQLEKVSIYDNFFELGANSIILVKINSKLREILSIELPLVDMFTYPNIKALSQHIAKQVDTPETISEVPQLERNQIKSSIKKRRQLRQKD